MSDQLNVDMYYSMFLCVLVCLIQSACVFVLFVYVNEAFAALYLAAMELGLDRDKTNGGANGIGCPLVASVGQRMIACL